MITSCILSTEGEERNEMIEWLTLPNEIILKSERYESLINDTCIYYLEQYLLDREMKGLHSKYLLCNEKRRLECGRFVADKMKTASLRRIMKNLAKKK